jgi:hypothetical protein
MGQLAGDQIGLVALGHGDDHVGIVGAGIAQHAGRCRIADHGAQVELVLQLHQAWAVVVDHRDVVFFRNQAFGHAGTDLAGPENDHFHTSP